MSGAERQISNSAERQISNGAMRIPFLEYPRPQLYRGAYYNLNGVWEYAIRKSSEPFNAPDGTIVVPYSPETELSGVKRTLLPGETLYYRKNFTLPEELRKKRAILHFGAVDMDCAVFLNGARLGAHRGGFNAFSFDATEFLRDGENEIFVAVTDDTDKGFRTRSKQTFRRGGIWYSPTSGIWQTVWLESVPERYIERLEILPNFDDASVTVRAIGKNVGRVRFAVTDRPYFETETDAFGKTGAQAGENSDAQVVEKADPQTVAKVDALGWKKFGARTVEKIDAQGVEKTATKGWENPGAQAGKEADAQGRESAGARVAECLDVRAAEQAETQVGEKVGGRFGDPNTEPGGSTAILATAESDEDGAATLSLAQFEPWSPERPRLYGITVTTDSDTVKSYFGMRKFEVAPDAKGIPRFFLNGKPYFIHGLLDQGYWREGMYTPPDDSAFARDILTAKSLGFNALRKHIKVEPLRWYYHADRLGVLVLQDMPSGGARYKNRVTQYYPFVGLRLKDDRYRLFGRENPASREEFESEYREMISALKNVVSLAVWVPFNEGWGQFDANRIAELTRELDPTRPVDHASGWHDQGGGDFNSLHIYFKPVPKIRPEKARAAFLSEFGGFSLKIPGCVFDENKTFGYKVFKDAERLNRAFYELYRKEVAAHIEEGLSGDIYTELSDVEDEVNGVVTFDRAEVKIDAATGARVKAEIDAAFAAACGDFAKKTEGQLR